MLKDCVRKWDENKEKLEKNIRENLDEWLSKDYTDIVEVVVKDILEISYDNHNHAYNPAGITVIDDGDYQGSILYVIRPEGYQPDIEEYLMTTVNYGSCSGCDTLKCITEPHEYGDADEEDIENAISGYMTLCLHLIQKMKRPYGKEDFPYRNDNDIMHVSRELQRLLHNEQ